MRKLPRLFLALCLTYAPFALAETVLKRGNGTEPETLDIHQSSGVSEANMPLAPNLPKSCMPKAAMALTTQYLGLVP